MKKIEISGHLQSLCCETYICTFHEMCHLDEMAHRQELSELLTQSSVHFLFFRFLKDFPLKKKNVS